jgi:hypothetical protein
MTSRTSIRDGGNKCSSRIPAGLGAPGGATRRSPHSSLTCSGVSTPAMIGSSDRAHERARAAARVRAASWVARNLDGWVRNSVDIPRIARRVQLPAFECDAHHPYVWPRSSSVDAGNLMFRAISELSSRSA